MPTAISEAARKRRREYMRKSRSAGAGESAFDPQPPVRNPEFLMPWGTHKGKPIGRLPTGALIFLARRYDAVPGCRKPPWNHAKAELEFRLGPEGMAKLPPPKPRAPKKLPAETTENTGE